MDHYVEQLARLYSAEAQVKQDRYLQIHSRNRAVIRRQASIFESYREFLSDARTILDWGCRHAADACLVRMLKGTDVELHGCDIDKSGEYPAFFDFAQLKYSQLTHPYQLPYETNSFDVVIGSGVLEHVPNDSESLKELYRVIRPGGYFITTMLPNRYSYTEWLNRRLRNPHHLRLYSLSEARHLFMHHGFLPVRLGYHQLVPTLSSPNGGIFDLKLANRFVEKAFSFNPFLEKLWPVNKIATNLFIAGKKVEAFHG